MVSVGRERLIDGVKSSISADANAIIANLNLYPVDFKMRSRGLKSPDLKANSQLVVLFCACFSKSAVEIE